MNLNKSFFFFHFVFIKYVIIDNYQGACCLGCNCAMIAAAAADWWTPASRNAKPRRNFESLNNFASAKPLSAKCPLVSSSCWIYFCASVAAVTWSNFDSIVCIFFQYGTCSANLLSNSPRCNSSANKIS